jgi:hypothetical protein
MGPQLVTFVITTCTNRKRRPIESALIASKLPQALIDDVASEWGGRLSAAADRFPARDIYGGRSFQEAALAAELLGARLLIVSAGLGLVNAGDRVPPYACTVVVDAPDSIASRVVDGYSVADWWRALNAVSPFSKPLAAVVGSTDGLICAALSDTYIEMIADELCRLPPAALARLRLFTRAPLKRVAPGLRKFVMPYDDRLDGPDSPVRGTRGDFAGRAVHHFAEFVIREIDSRSADEHATAVLAAQKSWRMAERFNRQRLDDAAVLDLIRAHWQAEHGSTARLLRRLRDDLGVACEQGRFAHLARKVRSEKA